MWWVASVVVLLGCGSAPTSGDDEDIVDPEVPVGLAFEPYSPPQSTSYDIFVAARGEVIVLGDRISTDGGASWRPSPVAGADRVAIHGTSLVAYLGGLVRYDLASQQLTSVAGAPAYTAAQNWRTARDGSLVVFEPIQNAIAIERASGWSTLTLPQPTPTDFDPYIADVERTDDAMLVVSGWGIYRATTTGFERLRPASTQYGRELVVREDGTFALLGGATTLRFDATGAVVGESPGIAVGTQDAKACEDGALLVHDQISRDGGASWQPFLADNALALTVERFGCGAGYWLLGHSERWGYRLVRYADPEAEGTVVGNWELAGEIAWSSRGPQMLRTTTDFISAGLAWATGSRGWRVREIPVQTFAWGDALHGVTTDRFFTSTDAGRSWLSQAATGLDGSVEAFARAPDGAYHVAQFATATEDGTDRWRARVWRSLDGARWDVVYDASATRAPGEDAVGEVHRFVTITPDGTWLATDATSRDHGATWQPSEHLGDLSRAFVTPSGHLVTTRDDRWHVYEPDGTLVATWQLEAAGAAVSAADATGVVFDEAGYAYVARGTPYTTIWRSARSVLLR